MNEGGEWYLSGTLCSVFKENDWYGTWVRESVILCVGEDDVSEMFNVVPARWR